MRLWVGLLVALAGAQALAADGTLPTSATHEIVWVPPTSIPIRGPRFAPVTIDAFVALGHPPSSGTLEMARRAVERGHGDVRLVLHLFTFGQPSFELSSEAALEAAVQARFWPFIDRLARERAALPGLPELVEIGRDAGLDVERLSAALVDRRHRALAERLSQESRTLNHHPPELLVNGRRVSPWSGDDAIARAIADARLRARQLLDEGVPLTQLYERVVEGDEEMAFVGDPLARPTRHRVAIDLSSAPLRGPTTAPVTIVLFANFACLSCAETAAMLKRVVDAHPGLVRLCWKNFPPPYTSSIGLVAAEVAEAAQVQGRFWALYDLAFKSRMQAARLSRTELVQLAAQAGMDVPRLERELAAGAYRPAVEREREEARRIGVPTAGSVLVDGVPVIAPSLEVVQRLVDSELDTGVLERLKGMAP
jgi:protein-disulfide isomerase